MPQPQQGMRESDADAAAWAAWNRFIAKFPEAKKYVKQIKTNPSLEGRLDGQIGTDGSLELRPGQSPANLEITIAHEVAHLMGKKEPAAQAIAQAYGEKLMPQQPQQPIFRPPPVGQSITFDPPPIGGAIQFDEPQGQPAPGIGRQLLTTGLNTMGQAAQTAVAPVIHPIDTAKGIATMPYDVIKSHADEAQKAWEAFQRGDRSEGVLRALASIVPVAGPIIANYFDADQSGKEKIAGSLIGGMAQGRALQGRTSIPVTPALRNRNPVAQQAVDFARREGIPVDAATATGNRAVAGVQFLADRSLGGQLVAPRAAAAQESALASTGRGLAAKVSPTASSGYQAGEAIQQALQARVAQYGSEAAAGYADLRAIENDPALTKKVTIRVPTTDSTGATKMSTVTVDMQMPVNLRVAKAQLKPIAERMQRQMPVAMQRADPALHAIQNILDSPDYLPASIVDMDLSAIKALARSEGPKSVSQGMASAAVSSLEGQLQAAVAQGGQKAIEALKQGRAATIAKHETADLLKSLRDEPRQAFEQATWANDSGIDRLKAIQREAPSALPKVGRAYLDELLDTATAEGGFSKARGIQAKWEKLGPQTKQLLFPDGPLRTDLDNFFRAAKNMSDNPNPSGTGHIVSLTGQGAMMLTEPVTGAAIQLTGAALSKLLHSPAGVRALTQGIRVPIGGNAAAAATTFAAISRAMGENK